MSRPRPPTAPSPPTAPAMTQRALPMQPAKGAAPSDGRPAGVTTVEGEVVRVTFENAETGFRVLRVAVEGKGLPEPWIGVFTATPPGTRVRATGRYERDAKHGEQLRVDSLLAVAPSTVPGIERYLGSGMVHGIGPVLAKRIVATFGERTLEVLDRSPERLAEVSGLGARRAEVLAKAWEKQQAASAIMIFLQGHGVTPALANRIVKRFGPRAMEVVSKHPYRLALDVWGVGFKTADRIAQSIGIAPDAPERAQAGVYQTLTDLTGRGHVFIDRSDLVAQSALMLELDLSAVEAAVDALSGVQRVRVEKLGTGETAVYPMNLWEAEMRLARRLRGLLAHESPYATRLARGAGAAVQAFERRVGVELAPAQRAAVEQAARHKVCVVTGGPGVGKTTIVRALLSLFTEARVPVRLAAPTGRAAKRMTEATGQEALTLHRMLEFDPKLRGFARKLGRPIDAGAVIVDEASMIDVELADALLQALADDAHLVIVGDVDQLPSVGPGAVLRDVIASNEVPTVRLSQIFRQAEGSKIVHNAHRIHDGLPPEGATEGGGEFYVFERTDPVEAADLVLKLVTQRIPKGFGLDARRDIQVLTPIHKGEAGTIALNERLQQALNPEGASVTRGSRVLRVGDKVMQTRNDYDREVWNGDIGFITSLDEGARKMMVRFDEREVAYEESELDELVLAYATTIHKSQGSEYAAVIVPILTQHYVMLSRNLIYTAVTRGKRLVVLVADPRAIGIALGETRKEDRRTHLAERIRQAG